jgi:tRNA-dihydrouridine synthase
MSFKKQTRSLHGNKTKPHSDLSHHYREIGIKAVAVAARKHSNAPQPSGRSAQGQGEVQRRIPMNEDKTAKAAREAMDKTAAAGAETARGVQEGLTSAVESVRELNEMIPADWLRKKITVVEAEADHPGISDDRVSRYPQAARPFGFLNREWQALKAAIKPGDELWSFISPTDQRLAGRIGVALLRDSKVVKAIITTMN